MLDGVLGYPSKLYDASWIEWGQMTGEPGKGGALAPDSPWRTDVAGLSAAVTYNADTLAVDTIAGASSYALRADMVNVADSSVCGGRGRAGDGAPAAPGY
jgi:hypothetical protein